MSAGEVRSCWPVDLAWRNSGFRASPTLFRLSDLVDHLFLFLLNVVISSSAVGVVLQPGGAVFLRAGGDKKIPGPPTKMNGETRARHLHTNVLRDAGLLGSI